VTARVVAARFGPEGADGRAWEDWVHTKRDTCSENDKQFHVQDDAACVLQVEDAKTRGVDAWLRHSKR
jgi:hypothetical protein